MVDKTTLDQHVTMDVEEIYQGQRKAAKYAAIAYGLLAILSGFSILFFDSLIVWDNPAQTAQNILDAETMVRISIVTGLIGQICFLFLGIAFYRLFNSVNRDMSLVLLVLVIASVPIAMLNAGSSFAALYLLTEPRYLALFGEEKLYSMVMLFLKLNQAGIFVAGFFWGLWLFPLGYLAYTSGYFPKFIGIFLILGSASYAVDSVLYFISTSAEEVSGILVGILSGIGEFSMVLWLIFKGPNIPKPTLDTNLNTINSS